MKNRASYTLEIFKIFFHFLIILVIIAFIMFYELFYHLHFLIISGIIFLSFFFITFSFFYHVFHFFIIFHHFCFQWCKNFPQNGKLQFSSSFFHFFLNEWKEGMKEGMKEGRQEGVNKWVPAVLAFGASCASCRAAAPSSGARRVWGVKVPGFLAGVWDEAFRVNRVGWFFLGRIG